MFYKNYSCIAKTFYGVTFQPGEIKEVDGIINDKMVVRVDESATKKLKVTQQKPSPEQPKDVVPSPQVDSVKAEDTKKEPEAPKEEPAKTEDKTSKGKKS